MTPFPLPLTELLGKYGAYFIFLLIGIGFGFVLESSGFGNSKKLAAQFYFKDMTVLKVMFGSIVTAMVLIFGASALGLLDYNLVWVNPTYLWPGIIGGLIMGVGFIIGGFCPGTSLVAAATWKLDGIFFVLGVIFGIFIFGETVRSIDLFWNSSYMGRFTIMDWLGLSTGWVVLIIVLGVYPKPVFDRIEPSVEIILDRIEATTSYEVPEFGTSDGVVEIDYNAEHESSGHESEEGN
jgi:hypothetical protein